MHLQVTDGRAELASFAISSDDAGTIMCFSKEELYRQKAILDENKIPYSIESIEWTDAQRQTVEGKTCATADEARQDLDGAKKPTETEALRKENADLKLRIEDLEIILADVVAGGDV